MTIEIPLWLLYGLMAIIGIPLAIFILTCAYIGFMVLLWNRRTGSWWF